MVAFTRKIYKTPRSTTIRKSGNQTKGIYHTIKRKITPLSIHNKNTQKVRTIHNENESRKLRRAKRKAKEWKSIVEQINEPDILDNIGLYINETGKLVSSEEPVIVAQYDLLIEELENKLDPFSNDDYEEKIINKAIRFVIKARSTYIRNLEHTKQMNSLETMMAGLSTV